MFILEKQCNRHSCTVSIPNDRTYCSKHHNKYEVIHQMKQQFKLNKKFRHGVEICEMFLNNYNADNSLQPTGPVSEPPSKKTKFKDFMDEFSQYGDCLLAMVGDKKSKVYKDLVCRAVEVVSALVMYNFKKLRLMDGHGRMVYLIYNEIKEQGHLYLLDYLEIE